MRIKLTSSVDILLFEKVGGLELSHPNVSCRHLFGFEYGRGAHRATIIGGVENPLVSEWREATEQNQTEAAAKQASQSSENAQAVTTEVVTEEPQSDS